MNIVKRISSLVPKQPFWKKRAQVLSRLKKERGHKQHDTNPLVKLIQAKAGILGN